MTSFGRLFINSQGKPINYNGILLHMSDVIAVDKQARLLLTFESVNSDWKQGVDLITDGSVVINGLTLRRGAFVWQHTAPRVVPVVVNSKKGQVRVKNIWDTGDGVVHSGHNGGAMIVEQLPNGRRYRCNDGYPDDDFDDLIFTIEYVK